MADAAALKASALVGALQELGPAGGASEAALKDVLRQYPLQGEAAAAEVVGWASQAGTAEGGGQQWDMAVLVDALRTAAPQLDWVRVAQQLDYPGFEVPSAVALQQLAAAFRRASPAEASPLPAAASSRIWTNSQGQLSLLRQATMVPPEVVSWEAVAPKLEPVEGLHANKLPIGTPNQAWLCLDLYSTLAALARGGHAQGVRHVLEHPMKHCPEVLLLGLASAKEGWGPLQQEVVEPLVVTYIASHPNSAVVQPRLWALNRELVLRGMVALYQKDATTIARVLDVSQDLKALTPVLDSTPAPFCIELAALASRREYLNLEKWLAEQFAGRGLPFVQASVAFLGSKLRDEPLQLAGMVGVPAGGKINISLETLAIFLRVLGANTSLLPPDLLQHFKVVQTAALQQYPQLAAVVGDAGAEAFSPEVENEANAYFQRAYAGEMSVGQLVELLRGFQASGAPREQEVFACMVHSLFDEYRFFHNYPDKELHTTAALFGALVHHGLVSGITLGIALRYILEALRPGPASKMFRFATTALRGCREDLPSWPDYCRHMQQIEGFKEGDPELFSAVERAASGGAPTQPAAEPVPQQAQRGQHQAGEDRPIVPGAPPPGLGAPPGLAAEPGKPAAGGPTGNGAAGPAATPAASAAPPSAETTPQKAGRPDSNAAGFPLTMPAASPSNPNMLFSTINAETLEQAAQNVDFPVPEEKVIDRVGFIMNNITMQNIDTKIRDLNNHVKPEFHPWFANYLVVKRAAQEPNFHAVYVAIGEKWNDRKLRDNFTKTTIHYLKVMLGSPMLKTSSSERTLLKNLGAFLGRLTIAKNRPVLQKDLDVKATILSAYEAGRMTAVLPFVRLLLEPCMDSKVFKPPNPWVMGILALLVEIYNLDGLKTGIKFEVELLLKSLNLQLPDVPPSTLLPGRHRDTLGNMDFQADKLLSQGGGGAPPPGAAAPGGATGPPSGGAAAAAAAAAGASTPVKAGQAATPPPPPDGKQMPPPSPAAPAAPPPPMIDPNVIANLHNFIVINLQLAVVGERLQLKRLVPMAVDRAIVEIISPVVDRSVTIACMTTQELVLKDYALEPDVEAVRRAAHQMVTGLAQSLALVTAKEPLRIAVGNNLRALLQAQLEQATLDQVVSMLVNDNLDLCCQVIEKAAAERAQREIDERLQPAYNARIRAKQAGQQFVDSAQLQGRFPGALPEALRPRPRQLTAQQQRVYDDFARIPRTAQAAQQSAGQPRPPSTIPGGQGEGSMGGEVGSMDEQGSGGAPTTAAAAAAMAAAPPAVPAADLRTRFLTWLQRMEHAIAKDPQALLSAQPEGSEVRVLVAEVASIPNNELAALEVAKNIFAKLYQSVLGSSRLHITAYAGALEVLRDAALRRLPVDATSWFVQLPEDTKFNKDVGEALVRCGLLFLPDLDLYLAKAMAGPRFQLAAEFALHLVQQCVIVDPVLSGSELGATLDMLSKLAVRVSGGGSVLQLVEEARRLTLLRAGKGAPPAGGSPGAPAALSAAPKPPDDPPQLVETVMKLFDRWARLLDEQPTEKVHKPFVQELHSGGLLKGDEMTDRFLRIMIQLAVQHCLRSEAQALAAQPPGAPRPAALNFVAVDACCRLMVCLVQQHGGGPSLFAKVLGIMAVVLQRDAEERMGNFSGRPYFRMCVGFLNELSPTDPADEAGWRYLQAMATFLYATRTLAVPSFAFPWLQLVSDKRFMPKLLMAAGHRGWPAYLQLIISQLRFLEPFLRNAELTDAVRLLYKGTLRVLLVLLHDFPEFLCQFHFQLCDVIPPSCIQMRNLALSAFPRAMRLPDPFTPNLKVDMLPEIGQPPRFVPDPDALLPAPLKAEVDAFLQKRAPANFLLTLRGKLSLSPQDAAVCGTRYNVLLINALVFYLGIRAVEGWAPTPGTPPVMQTPSMEVFQHLLHDMDTEGRYLLINALANHLRYPNLHTHYFSCAILFLFTEAGSELVQEQVTRVLLERLIVNRPHPWGLLITFIELIKNPRYSFWSHAFTRVAPEIERLFESVARSCMGPQPMPPSAGQPGGLKPDDAQQQQQAPQQSQQQPQQYSALA